MSQVQDAVFHAIHSAWVLSADKNCPSDHTHNLVLTVENVSTSHLVVKGTAASQTSSIVTCLSVQDHHQAFVSHNKSLVDGAVSWVKSVTFLSDIFV